MFLQLPCSARPRIEGSLRRKSQTIDSLTVHDDAEAKLILEEAKWRMPADFFYENDDPCLVPSLRCVAAHRDYLKARTTYRELGDLGGQIHNGDVASRRPKCIYNPSCRHAKSGASPLSGLRALDALNALS